MAITAEAVVTGCGNTVRGARKSAYAAVKKISIPNTPFYRPDIGAGRVREGIPAIQRHGYASSFVLV